MNTLIRALSAVAWVVTASALGACASIGAKEEQNALAGLSDEAQLRVRVQQRWDDLIAMRMAAVYEFATPSYRATYDLRHFTGQYAGQVRRKRAAVESIEIDEAAQTAIAKVRVHSLTEGFNGGPPIELSTVSKDTWMKLDGQWWFVEPR